jgi:acyl-CoA synthetase (AMP-forming)/AMP-acid ligase II
MDPEDRSVPTRHIGEIVARGTQLMRSYWKLPDTSPAASAGGMHTGDAGCFDTEGFL